MGSSLPIAQASAACYLPRLLPQLLPPSRPSDASLHQLLRLAMLSNSVEALSHLLVCTASDGVEMSRHPWLEENAEALLRATFPLDGAECCLTLLNCLEERRRKKQDDSSLEDPAQRRTMEQFVSFGESFCDPAPNSSRLIKLASEALEQADEPWALRSRVLLLLLVIPFDLSCFFFSDEPSVSHPRSCIFFADVVGSHVNPIILTIVCCSCSLPLQSMIHMISSWWLSLLCMVHMFPDWWLSSLLPFSSIDFRLLCWLPHI